jgi:hypothetical protein
VRRQHYGVRFSCNRSKEVPSRSAPTFLTARRSLGTADGDRQSIGQRRLGNVSDGGRTVRPGKMIEGGYRNAAIARLARFTREVQKRH